MIPGFCRQAGLCICLLLFVLPARGQLRTQEHTTIIKPPPDSSYSRRQLEKGILLMPANPDSGRMLCRQVLEDSRLLQDSRGIGRALYGLGLYYSVSEQYDQAIYHYLQAIRHFNQDPLMYRTIRSCIFNIGECYYRKGAYPVSAYYFYKLLSIMRTRSDDQDTRINIYNRLAAIWAQFRMKKQAFYYSELQERMAVIKNDSLALSRAWCTKAGLYLAEGMHDHALRYYLRALEVEKRMEKHLYFGNQQTINNNIALIHIHRNELTQAIYRAQEALRLQPVPRSIIGLIDAHCMLGFAYARLKQYNKAERYLDSALKDADARGITGHTSMARFALAEIYRYTGRYRDAADQLFTYIHINDSLRGEKNAQATGMLEAKYRDAEKDRQLAQKQLLLAEQRARMRVKNFWLFSISAGTALLSITLIALYRSNRNRQRLQQHQIRLLRQEQEILQQQQEIIQLNAMMKGEEKERTRIARELHDGIGGMLAAIKMNVNTIQESRMYHEAGHSHLGRIMRMVEETTSEIRKTAHNLMPDILTRHSLPEALQIYCQHIRGGGIPNIMLRIYGSLEGLDKNVELILYRIIQELVQNIVKHAGADEAVIELTQQDDTLHIAIEDNGCGFDVRETGSGFGLQNLRHRVHALRGELTIESAHEVGTTIGIKFDLIKLRNIFTT